MSRLIDADVLQEAITQDWFLDILLTQNGKADIAKRLTDMIDSVPLAYDVEKVVADLEKKKEIHTEHYNISIYKDFPEIKSRYKQIQGVINKAIDIVKGGGIE